MRFRGAASVVVALAVAVTAAVVVTAVRSEATAAGAKATSIPTLSLVRAAGSTSVVATSIVTVPPMAGQSAAAGSSSAAAAADRAPATAVASRSAASGSAAAAESARAAASRAAASRAAASSVAVASRFAAAISAASVSAAAHPAADTTAAVEEATDDAANSGITQSVIVMDRQTGSVTTSVNPDLDVPSMSLVKLLLAADVIDEAGGVENVDQGTLALLRQMIVASDDSIAQDFYDQGGRGDIITRVADRYGLGETRPSPDPEYWGDVQITANDMASFLFQLLSQSETAAWFIQAMQGSQDEAADGFDQDFGVNAVPDAGSKQGWGGGDPFDGFHGRPDHRGVVYRVERRAVHPAGNGQGADR